MVIDRRKHKRFLVKGAVEMKTPAGNFRGELVSISGGGFLLGLILGLVGGILGIVWKPSMPMPAPMMQQPMPPQ